MFTVVSNAPCQMEILGQRPLWSDAARTDALTLFGLMVGTLQLSRALTDRDLSDQLLAQGAETALQLLDDRACTRA